MSDSHLRICDKCGENFLPTLGCLSIDAGVYTDVDTMTGWDDIDLCHACSKPVIALLRPAMDDLQDLLPE